jgi:hypothetical protein
MKLCVGFVAGLLGGAVAVAAVYLWFLLGYRDQDVMP